MHPALHLEEILLDIFGQCYPPAPVNEHRAACATADLAALARTCRTFKEPALDVLWTELTDLSPLARCLPGASHRISPGNTWYSFSRPLTPAEWDTLRGYARRVQFIKEFMRGLHWASVKMLFNPPTPDPLFSNLRILRWEFVTESFPFLHHLAVSSLTCLEINFVFDDVPPCHIFPRCLGDLCPNIRRFRIRVRRPQVGSDEAISGLVRCWTSLQVLHCPYITLDVDAIFHLSRTPSLTNLSFALGTAIADQIAFSRSTLLFSGLRDLDISSQTWASLSTLLPHTRLPSMESFAVYTDCCPSEYTLPSCLTALRNVCTPQSLVSLKLIQSRSSRVTGSERYQLGRDDLQPCMSFGHLRRLEINTAGTVHLTDSDLLHLTSAWPGLEHLLVGEAWGWGTVAGGITPRGLLHLLERLRALCHVCLAVDTRGYSDVETARASTRAAGFAPRAPLSVNVVDSGVHPESVDALAAFFGGILQRDVLVSARYWCTTAMAGRPDAKRSQKLWEEVFAKAYERAGPQSQSHCLESAA